MQKSVAHVLLQSGVFLASFVSGGLLGARLAAAVAPGSALAATLSSMMFPIALALGFTAWLGLAILSLPLTLFRIVTKAESGSNERSDEEPPPGSIAFLLVCVPIGLVVGCVSGLVPGGWGPVDAAALYGAVAAVFGVILWRLARAGLLPFLDE